MLDLGPPGVSDTETPRPDESILLNGKVHTNKGGAVHRDGTGALGTGRDGSARDGTAALETRPWLGAEQSFHES
jgi:hypothetical protein